MTDTPSSAAPRDEPTELGEPGAASRDVPAGPGNRPSERMSLRRRSVSGAMTGLLVGLLGFALVVQVKSNTGDAQLANARQDDLVRILSDLNAREQRLRTEINTLETTLSQLGAGAQGREAALAEARRRADELGILAGTLPAQGEGLRIRLVPNGSPIPASTVLEAVEELRGAGAEAMQIGGSAGGPVRIVASTYFVDAGDGIDVDGRSLAGEYTLTVIGPAATMRTALTIPGGVADAVARDGGNVIVDEPGAVTINALHAAEELSYARPTE
jgi:uncharacterized protein YlxW (UPF0749 family)